MRWLFGTLLAVVLLWCAYWYVGAQMLTRQTEALFAAQSQAGRVANHQGIAVAGFPSRFDLTITAPQLADPDRGIGWSGSAIKLYAMTWKPWHILAALPADQELQVLGQSVKIASSELSASLRAKPRTDLPLAEARLIGRDLALHSSAGWSLGAQGLAFALRSTAVDGSYDLGLEIREAAPDPRLLSALAAVKLPQMPETSLPETIARLHLDARLALSAPLDRFVADSKPQLTGLELRDLSLEWGDLHLVAKGNLGPDAQGFAAGEIQLQATNWQHLPVVLVALGLVPERMAPTLGNMLRAVAKDSADGSSVTLPLKLKDGWMSFGPLPLGPAPRLVQLAG